LMFGYLRVQLLAAGTTREQVCGRFDSYAQVEGYAMGAVFVDQAGTAPAGFAALIEAVKRYDARAVAVPTLEHLAVLGAPPPLREFLQRSTGAQVLVMDPERTPGSAAGLSAGGSLSRRDGRADDGSASVPPHQAASGRPAQSVRAASLEAGESGRDLGRMS